MHVLTPSAQRMNALGRWRATRNYLEIGVETGNTFFAVEADNKTAVDPRFLFDVSSRQDSGATFYPGDSDSFFRQYNGDKFDIVFIDGLHIFEQVFRDFTNTLSVTHDNSIIIIDDVFPSDVYSSFRSWSDTMLLRKLYGEPSGDWHGDVYKMLFVVNDFFPSLRMALVGDAATNRQLCVWKRPRLDFSPIFDDFRKVYEASYFDLLKNQNKFITMDDVQLLAMLEKDLDGLGRSETVL